jgi:soluble lytic murein transglycosylase-like protein
LLFDFRLRKRAATFFARYNLRLGAAAATVAAALFAAPAYGQVMEIAADGTVSVRQGAGAATWQVVSPTPKSADQEVGAPAMPAAAVTTANGALIPAQYAAAINYAAGAANISPTLLAALVWQESRWNAQALSPKGAIGLAQLMPATARQLGVDPTDPLANLTGGARYLRQLLDQFDGNVENALAAYNAGPGRVRSAGGVPAIAETRTYVASIVRRIATLSSGGTP